MKRHIMGSKDRADAGGSGRRADLHADPHVTCVTYDIEILGRLAQQ